MFIGVHRRLQNFSLLDFEFVSYFEIRILCFFTHQLIYSSTHPPFYYSTLLPIYSSTHLLIYSSTHSPILSIQSRALGHEKFNKILLILLILSKFFLFTSCVVSVFCVKINLSRHAGVLIFVVIIISYCPYILILSIQ